MLKEKLLQDIINRLNDKIESLNQTIQSLIESRDNETKSSVGDKYETGREMVQQELTKNKIQLAKTERLKVELAKINSQKVLDIIDFGSLIFTSNGNYFISVALGKIDIEDESFYCISLASPIGKVLYKHKTGDFISFQQKKIEILKIE